MFRTGRATAQTLARACPTTGALMEHLRVHFRYRRGTFVQWTDHLGIWRVDSQRLTTRRQGLPPLYTYGLEEVTSPTALLQWADEPDLSEVPLPQEGQSYDMGTEACDSPNLERARRGFRIPAGHGREQTDARA